MVPYSQVMTCFTLTRYRSQCSWKMVSLAPLCGVNVFVLVGGVDAVEFFLSGDDFDSAFENNHTDVCLMRG